MTGPLAIPLSTDTPEDLKKLAARGYVLGCSAAMAREVARTRNIEQVILERIESLEASVRLLTALVLAKK
jgi:hypothetical protein